MLTSIQGKEERNKWARASFIYICIYIERERKCVSASPSCRGVCMIAYFLTPVFLESTLCCFGLVSSFFFSRHTQPIVSYLTYPSLYATDAPQLLYFKQTGRRLSKSYSGPRLHRHSDQWCGWSGFYRSESNPGTSTTCCATGILIEQCF